MPKPGDPFPDFELPNQDDNPARLSDYRGRKLVLFAFPKANTPGCTTQACGFRDQFPRIDADNAAVLGVSPDPPKKLRAWKDAENLPYDLLSDPDHKLLDILGAWGERSMYGKKYMGVIRSHWVIDEHGIVLDEQIKVSPTDSVARALKTVRG